MNLKVFREGDTVWIRDTATDDEWPLPAEVWAELIAIVSDPYRWQTQLPSVWGQVSAVTDGSARDNPDGRAT